MPITTRTSLAGFLLALSALSLPTPATASTDPAPQTVEARLSRLTAAMRERAEQLPEAWDSGGDGPLARGWADGRGSRGWVNGNRGGWGNGYRGGFANANPWRNGWADRGSFYNSRPRWGNGGTFLNRW